jgi:pimeloyl-ACP methyl ester carboxylesterase
VLLPGMNCSARLWAGLLPTFAPQSTSGVGFAPEVLTPRLVEPTLAAQVERLLDELPPRFDLVGLSLGAIVAMALVRTAPGRVSGLTLLSTNPHPPSDAQLAGWRRERDRLAAGTSAREIQHDLLPLLLTAEALDRRPDVVATTLAMADDVGEAALDAQLALQATRVDERPALRDVRCPTLVVAAHGDRLCPLDRHTEIASLIPGARLRVLERAGHLSPLEQPVAVGELIAGR